MSTLNTNSPKISSPLAGRRNADETATVRQASTQDSAETSIARTHKSRRNIIVDAGSDSNPQKILNGPRRFIEFNKAPVTTYTPDTLLKLTSICAIAKVSIAEALRLHQQAQTMPIDQVPLAAPSQTVV